MLIKNFFLIKSLYIIEDCNNANRDYINEPNLKKNIHNYFFFYQFCVLSNFKLRFKKMKKLSQIINNNKKIK